METSRGICGLWGGDITLCSTNSANNLPWAEALANAHLIAAAPDMRKALEAILVDAKNSPYTRLICATRGLIDEALSKAGGQLND